MSESGKPVTNESANELVRHDPARMHVEGEENQAEVRRRGSRRAAGQDTPAGAQTNRTVKRAEKEIAERGQTDSNP